MKAAQQLVSLVSVLVKLSQGSLEQGVWDFELLKENNYVGAVKNVFADTKVMSIESTLHDQVFCL